MHETCRLYTHFWQWVSNRGNTCLR